MQCKVGKKGKHVVTNYLIKWVGNCPLSWEPAGNVSSECVDMSEKKNSLGLITAGKAGAAFDAVLEGSD